MYPASHHDIHQPNGTFGLVKQAAGVDQVVILAAGKASRGRAPSAVMPIGPDSLVLDWLLDAFAVLPSALVTVVAGYRFEDIAARYSQSRIAVNPVWQSTGPLHSLAIAGLANGQCAYVSYSDIVVRRAAIERLAEAAGDVVVAVDSAWRNRYDGRGERALARAEKVLIESGRVRALGTTLEVATAHAEFAGIVRLAPHVVELVNEAFAAQRFAPAAGLPTLLQFLIESGVDVRAVDLHGEWAELDAQQDLARFVLGTKAESLERLRPMRHGGIIEELATLTWRQWIDNPDTTLREVLASMPASPLIVRSSAITEDTWNESSAGAHESILDVEPTTVALRSAITEVFESYGTPNNANQVLVQPMLREILMSGVVMTRTHAVGAPYYVLNFDDRSTRTDAVTAGRDARTVLVHRDASPGPDMPALDAVITVVRNIEQLVGHDSLDIEFAVTLDAQVHILQVRPIAVDHQPDPIDDADVAAALDAARAALARRIGRQSSMLGDSGHLSVMTDWNPAEIIGTKPRQLATSLYRHLITDEVWAMQRAEYGYRDVRPCPLLIEIAGHPYVDVRASFNSFIPAALADDLALRLAGQYLTRLARAPELHDKVEFDIALTCLTSEFAARADQLGAEFNANDHHALRLSLRDITEAGIRRLDRDRTDMDAIRHRIQAARAEYTDQMPIDRAFTALELARGEGTLMFAHLARAAFVATDLLRGFVSTGVLASHRCDAFLESIETVFGALQRDADRVHADELQFSAFVERYGHLRPGTYDITSPCYKSAPETYLQPLVDRSPNNPSPRGGALAEATSHTDTPSNTGAHFAGPLASHLASHLIGQFEWTISEARAIEAALDFLQLPFSAEEFTAFARGAISGREEGKFVFTMALSDALEAVAEFGAGLQLSRDDMSHLTIHDIFRCRDALVDPKHFLQTRVDDGRESFRIAQAICLPTQIRSAVDLVRYEQPNSIANFVTQTRVEAQIIDITADPDGDVAGKIVLIPSADPGYDSLLARGIAGLITMFGGANSHMAVRAAESSLPAAIGVGERKYQQLVSAVTVRLDCGTHTITVVN